jgi:hypothetical protein
VRTNLPPNMDKLRKPIPWLSGGLAMLAGLFIVAVTVPNFAPHPVPVFRICFMAFLPGLCIFTLGRRWILFDWLAWIFLAFLLVSELMG